MRNFDRRVYTALLIVFVQLVGASMALPVLPLYARRDFAMEPQVITLLISSFFAAQFFASPYIGRLSDQYGRIPVLIISQIGTALSFLALGLGQSVWILFAARIFDGITGGNIIVVQAYVTDITPKEERTQVLGLIFAAFGLGFVFGPALGGALAAFFGDRAPFLIAAVAATITFILTWFILEETLTPEQREANKKTNAESLNPIAVLKNFPLMMILAMGFGGQFGLGLFIGTFALFGETVLFAGQTEQSINLGIGMILATVGVGQLFAQLVALRPLLKRYGGPALVLIGTIIRGISMLIFSLLVSPLVGGLGGFTLALGAGLMMPPLQSLSTETMDDSLRGGVLGWYQSAISLATILSTALSGWLFNIDARLAFYASMTLYFVLILPALFLIRWTRTHDVSTTPNAPATATAAD